MRITAGELFCLHHGDDGLVLHGPYRALEDLDTDRLAAEFASAAADGAVNHRREVTHPLYGYPDFGRELDFIRWLEAGRKAERVSCELVFLRVDGHGNGLETLSVGDSSANYAEPGSPAAAPAQGQ